MRLPNPPGTYLGTEHDPGCRCVSCARRVRVAFHDGPTSTKKEWWNPRAQRWEGQQWNPAAGRWEDHPDAIDPNDEEDVS